MSPLRVVSWLQKLTTKTVMYRYHVMVPIHYVMYAVPTDDADLRCIRKSDKSFSVLSNTFPFPSKIFCYNCQFQHIKTVHPGIIVYLHSKMSMISPRKMLFLKIRFLYERECVRRIGWKIVSEAEKYNSST